MSRVDRERAALIAVEAQLSEWRYGNPSGEDIVWILHELIRDTLGEVHDNCSLCEVWDPEYATR